MIKWWKDEDVEVWQFLGKDIAKFHGIYWPAMLKSVGLRLPSKLIIHGFFTVEGEKMSKTLGNVVSPFDLSEKYGSDVVRYYCLREFSISQDGNFSEESLLERYNNELANGLGNLLSRVITLIEKEGGEVKFELENSLLSNEISQLRNKYDKAFSDFKINKAVESWLQLVSLADAFINEKEPWKMTEGSEKKKVLFSLWLILVNLVKMIGPFMPDAAEKMKDSLGFKDIKDDSLQKMEGKIFKVKKIESLFPKKE